jgi:hypothetical protein
VLKESGPYNRDYFWDWIPSRGRSGGVLTRVKIDRFDIGSRAQGKFIM